METNGISENQGCCIIIIIALSSRLFGAERANGYQIVSIIDVSNVSSRLTRSPGPLTLWREPPSIFFIDFTFFMPIFRELAQGLEPPCGQGLS